MTSHNIPDLNFDHLFLDDGSEDCNFGFKSSADNINMLAIDPKNDYLLTNSVPATPNERKKFIFSTPLKLQTKELENDVCCDNESRQPTSKDSGNSIPNYEKSDLNMKVDELVNGFRNTQFNSSGDQQPAKSISDFKTYPQFISGPNEVRASQLFETKDWEPVNSSKTCNRNIVSTNTTEEIPSEDSENSSKPKRWGKEEDKVMYDHLRRLSTYYGIAIDDLALPESMTNHTHYKMLLTLKREMSWVGTTRQILKRICILKQNTSLSVRDKRSLRKLINQQVANRNPSLDLLLYEFPCKNISEITKIANRIFQRTMKIIF